MADRKRKAATAASSSPKKTKNKSVDEAVAQNANGNATPTRRVTRQMTTDGPRRAAFETAEILENILVHLPPKNIFGVQRVSKQFRDVIATSPGIQTKLYLRSAGKPKQAWTLRYAGTPERIFAAATDEQYMSGRYVTPVTLSPFYNLWQGRLFPSWSHHAYDPTKHAGQTVALNARKIFTAGKHESWMDTLICDPPAEMYRVSIEYRSLNPGGSIAFRTHMRAALTSVDLGRVYTFKAFIRAMMKSEDVDHDVWPVHLRLREIGGTLEQLLRAVKQKTGVPLQLGSKSGKGVRIKMHNAVVPTQAELDLSGLKIF